jgi:hypothetical protein
MSFSIFYSWQSDSPNSTNRGFIEKALEQTIKGLGRDLELQEALRDETIEIDKDTKGIPGTPPIVEAIFNKISECGVFVPDLTFVAKANASDRLSPNPNVLIEYGWALKSIGHSRIVPVMNTAFGEPTAVNMPFDMRHLRNPITYRLEESAGQETKARVKTELAKKLEQQIGLIIKTRLARTSETIQTAYTPTPATSNPSTFLQPGETFFSDGLARRLSIPDGQRLFLRLIPSIPNRSLPTTLDVLNLARRGQLMPMQAKPGGWGWDIERNRHGAFAYAEEHSEIIFFSQLFKTGEIWGIDARSISMKVCKENGRVDFGYFPSDHLEKVFLDTLENYLQLASGELSPALPLRFMAGATDVEGYRMTAPPGIRFYTRDPRFGGRVDARNIVFEGEIDEYGKDPAVALLPFFEYLWRECGVERPIAR